MRCLRYLAGRSAGEPLPGVVQVRRGAMQRLSRLSRPVKFLVGGRQAGGLLGTVRGPAECCCGRLGVEHGPVDGAGRHAEGLGDLVDVGQPPAERQSTMMAPTSRSAAYMSGVLP